MAAPRIAKYFKQLEEGLYNLGYARAKAKLQSVDSEGNLIGYMNFSSASSTSGDQQFFIRMKAWEVAGLTWPESMRTQLHAAGQYAEGPVLVELVLQASDDAAISDAEAAHHKFRADVLHLLRGQLGAMVRVKLDPHATNPGTALIASGALVATASTWASEGKDLGVMLPYGRVVAPGSLA
jgi:hypothetical protein